ncbi:MAG: O-acetyl-ADP-ribose deacetylase [Desulfobacterales bacterium]|nr:O-acetyl-ADP-ribose deacetylase [Desulfobacterales bacterium]
MNRVIKTFLNGRVNIVVGDITKEKIDAIVNAANSTLMGGGGVDGAIHQVGGPKILEECKKLRQTEFTNGLPTGQVAITTGGNLPCKYVIHTVGPIRGKHEDEEKLLANCYKNSLNIAVEKKITTIAFPSISTGAYGYPLDEAANIASTTISDFLKNDNSIKEVRLVFFTHKTAEFFLENENFNDYDENF